MRLYSVLVFFLVYIDTPSFFLIFIYIVDSNDSFLIFNVKMVIFIDTPLIYYIEHKQ